MEKEYKIGAIIKYKNHFLRVEEENKCQKCFFNKKKCSDETIISSICIRPINEIPSCSCFARLDNKEIIYKRLLEIEELILKGSDNSED